MNIEQELDRLGKEIEQCKSELSKAEGSIETLMKRLKDEEGINSLEEAEKIIDELEKSISKMNEDIEKKIKELREIYEW